MVIFFLSFSVKLFLTDPKLGWECFFGPGTPYQYRLMGPGAWKGARKAIMAQWDRTYYPLHTRPLKQTTASDGSMNLKIYAIALVVLAVILYYLF